MKQENLTTMMNDDPESVFDAIRDAFEVGKQALEFIKAIEAYMIAKHGTDGMIEFTKEVARFQLERELAECGADEDEIKDILEDALEYQVDVSDLFKA